MTGSSARIPGLAHGWEGAAWTTLQRIAAGVTPARAAFLGPLARRLEAAVDADHDAGPGQLIGIGGAATVAVLAARLEPRLGGVARRLVARWAASSGGAARDDVLLGHPGALLAIAELVDQVPSFAAPARFVARCHRRTVAAIRRMLDGDRPHFVGLAHGLAGLMLAAECAAARLDQPRDAGLLARGLERLARSRMVAPGHGAIWSATTAQHLDGVARGWCHGTPGIALALAGCHRFAGPASGYQLLFAEAARAMASMRSSDRTFCCGRSGRAQILVELYRQRGERRWLAAARVVAAEPVAPALNPDYRAGFSQGALGIAYLEARLSCPALPLPATGIGTVSTR